jgi:hypothetical protein
LFQNVILSVSFSIWETKRNKDKSWVLISLLLHLKTRLCTAVYDHLSRAGEQTLRQCGACSNFLLRIPGKLITDPNSACELMDCLVAVIVDEFQNFNNIVCGFAGA